MVEIPSTMAETSTESHSVSARAGEAMRDKTTVAAAAE
jgi:hypothetical protein